MSILSPPPAVGRRSGAPFVEAARGSRIARPDRAATAEAMLRALTGGGDRVGAVVREAAAAAGAPAAGLWRTEGGRLLLAGRHGDEVLAAPEAAEPLADAETDVDAPNLPLELPVDAAAEPGVIRLRGYPFATVPLSDSLLAVGPIRGDRLGDGDRRRLAALSEACGPAVAEALRATALESELATLRVELDMGRRALGSTIDESRSFGLLLELAVNAAGGRGGFVAARGPVGFRLAATQGLPPSFAELDVTPGRGVLAAIPGLPGVLVVEAPEALDRLGVGGLLAVSGPADAAEPRLVFGLVARDDAPLPGGCADLLATLVEQAALVLESSELARGAAERHLAALAGLCRALDARSPTSEGHHERVRETAVAIADRMGLDPDQRRLVADAARVHDVGQVAAEPDEAVAAEYAHPTLGAEMASLVPGAAELAPLIRAHHEWWDGFGFPAGLRGESVPLGARVLAAAELYVETLEAAPAGSAEPVEEIRARRGVQLDPACADALLSILEE